MQSIVENPFESAVEKGIDAALTKIKRDFEGRENFSENLPYHNTGHTRFMVTRVGMILQALHSIDPELVTSRDIKVGKLAAAFHDIVQGYEIVDGRRKRKIGDNERDSAFILESYMRNEEVFKENEIEDAKEAILVTEPSWLMISPKEGTVIQPRLSQESRIIPRIVALVDINLAGLSQELFIQSGSALFREENLDIGEDLKKIIDGTLSMDKEEGYRKRILGWTNSQIGFAKGREILFPKEIWGITIPMQRRLVQMFSFFEESEKKAQKVLEKRENIDLPGLIADLGYLESQKQTS